MARWLMRSALPAEDYTVLDETYLALDKLEHDVLDPCLRHLLRRS